MVSVTKHNTPALRFDGFDGEWDAPSLGDLGVPVSGVGFPHSEQGGEAGTPFFKVSDMGRSANGRELLLAANYVSAEQIKKRGWQVVNGPAVVFAKVGAAVLLDRKRLVREQFLADNNLMAFVLSQTALSPDFALSLFGTLSLSSLVQVGALPSINGSQVKAMKVSIPSSLEEQRAIGEHFADLDALIEQHHAKHASLQQTKTALLQRMFPQDGADEPELRLGGSSNPWVLRHLGEFEITTGPFGSTLHAEDYVEHGTPIVTTEHFKSGLLPLTGQGVPQVSDDDRRRLKAYWLQTDDIVFSRVGSVDINARVTELQNGWLFSGRVLRVRPDATCESEFLHSVLETIPVRGSIRKRAVGMSMPSINTAILANTSFYQPPTLEEQRAIGEVFSNLDALIAAEQRYITQLTQAKTALLQRMFV